MTKKVAPKIISAVINLNDLKDYAQRFTNNLKDAEKNALIREVLELPNNYSDSIDFFVDKNKIVFYWEVPKINEQADKFHQKALNLARGGDLTKAILNWKEATSIDPYNPEYLFNLGVASFEQKKYEQCIEVLTRTLAICPIYYKAHLIIGTSYLKIRKFTQAKHHILKSLKYNKNNALAYLNLGTVNSVLRDYKNGLKMFERVIELSPNEPRAYMGIAKIYASSGNTEKANYYYKQVIKYDKKGNLANYAKKSLITANKHEDIGIDQPDQVSYENIDEYYSEGYRCYLAGHFDKAVQMYKSYLSKKQDDDYVWYALGESLLRLGEIESAGDSFKRAAKLSPQKGLYFKSLVIIFDKMKQYEKVIAAAAKAKELGKTDSVLYCIWGKALLSLNNVNEAIIMLDHSLKLNNNNLLTKYYLALALEKNDEIDNALGYVEEILKIEMKTPLKYKAEQLKERLIKKEGFSK